MRLERCAVTHCFCFLLNVEKTSCKADYPKSLCSPSYRSASSRGMEEESAVSSRYSVELSLSNPRSGTSSRSESKSGGDSELFPLRTINLRGTNHKDPRCKLEKKGTCYDQCLDKYCSKVHGSRMKEIEYSKK